MIAAFVKPELEYAAGLAAHIDAIVTRYQGKGENLEGCVAFLGGPEIVKTISGVASKHQTEIPLLYLQPAAVPPWLSLNPLVDSTVLLIQDHKVYRGFVNVSPAKFAEVSRAVDHLLKNQPPPTAVPKPPPPPPGSYSSTSPTSDSLVPSTPRS